MAGLNLVYGEGKSDISVEEVAEDTAKSIGQYEYRQIIDNDHSSIFFIGYPNYPISVIQKDEYTLIIEGHIYNLESENECAETIHTLLQSESTDSITEWMGEQDGDYILYYINDGNITIISDILGRLPLYYTEMIDDTVVSGRSIHFIKEILSELGYNLSLDREALAQILLLQYPFGRKTPYEEIWTNGPAGMLNLTEGSLSHNKLHSYDFGNKEHSNRSIDHNAKIVAEKLLDTTRRRCRLEGKSVVSLSGGKDSRLIAALLDEVGCNPIAATFYQENGWTMQDSRVAQEVVQQLGLDWSLFNVENTGGNMTELLYRKGGLNYFYMGSAVDFLHKLNHQYEKVQYFTGDVGDLIDTGWTVNEKFNSTKEAANWIIDGNKETSVTKVSNLTGVSTKDLTNFVVEHLNEFPEDSPRAKVEHFLTRERGISLDFQGEDRNRTFFWTHAPLNSRPVMEYLIKTPREQKRNYKLYKKVLDLVNSDMANIEYVPYGAPIGSFEHLLKEKGYKFIPNQSLIQKYILSMLFDKSGFSTELSHYILDQTDTNSDLESYFNMNELKEIVNNPEDYSSTFGYTLMTLTTLVEYVSSNNTTLRNYNNTIFP